MKKRIHDHSLSSHKAISQDGSIDGRRRAIIEILVRAQKPLTDYEILQRFKPGSDDLNLVRPRLTELHDLNVLDEGPPARSHAKNCNVRTSRLVEIKKQMELF